MKHFALNRAFRVALLSLAGMLSACAAQAPHDSDLEPDHAAAMPAQASKTAKSSTSSGRQQEQIKALLALAEQALEEDRLRFPDTDNAFLWFMAVIDQDETNKDAHRGMQRITARYLQLAEQAFKAHQPTHAESLLAGALSVAATPQQAEQLRAAYRAQQQPDDAYALAARDLDQRGAPINQQLRKIAEEAKNRQSRLLIVARNDAEGRWIYQQMRNAVNGYRLRGNIEVGQRPRIELLD